MKDYCPDCGFEGEVRYLDLEAYFYCQVCGCQMKYRQYQSWGVGSG